MGLDKSDKGFRKDTLCHVYHFMASKALESVPEHVGMEGEKDGLVGRKRGPALYVCTMLLLDLDDIDLKRLTGQCRNQRLEVPPCTLHGRIHNAHLCSIQRFRANREASTDGHVLLPTIPRGVLVISLGLSVIEPVMVRAVQITGP